MSLDKCFELIREMNIIEKQLANGEFDVREYNRQVRELEMKCGDYQCEMEMEREAFERQHGF